MKVASRSPHVEDQLDAGIPGLLRRLRSAETRIVPRFEIAIFGRRRSPQTAPARRSPAHRSMGFENLNRDVIAI